VNLLERWRETITNARRKVVKEVVDDAR